MLGASPASAATASIPATAITATSPTPRASLGGTIVVTGTLAPVNTDTTVALAVTAGLGVTGNSASAAATCALSTAPGVARGGYQCTFTVPASGTVPTTETLMAFADNNGNGTYDAGTDVAAAPVSVPIVGRPYRATIAPATAHTAQNTCSFFTVTVTDQAGTPEPGANVLLSASQTAPAATTLTYCGATAGTTTTSGSAPSITTTSTATSNATNINGQTTVGIMSDTTTATSPAVSAVTLTSTGTTSPANATGYSSGSATVTIDAGGNNSVTATGLTATPTSQTVFPGVNTVTIAYSLVNAQGDPVGGVAGGTTTAPAGAGINGRITSGPDAGGTVSCTASGDGITGTPGMGTCTYTTVATTAVPSTGTDSVQLWVNQSTGTTTGPDAGEPTTTPTVTVATEPAFNQITSNCDTGVVGPLGCLIPLTTKTQTVTFTLTADGTNKTPEAGYVIDIVSAAQTGPSAGTIAVSAPSCTTASDGTCSVTVTDPTPTDSDSITLTASVHGDTTNAALSDTTAKVSWQPPQATFLVVSPEAATNMVGATVTKTVTATDQYGNPVANVLASWGPITGRNNSGNNSNVSGTCLTGASGTCTFSYTDSAGTSVPTNTRGMDTIPVSATFADTTLSSTAYQYWVSSGGTATSLLAKATIGSDYTNPADCGTLSLPATWTPTTLSTGTTPPSITPTALVCVGAQDVNNLAVYGQPVTVTSSGVGQLLTVNPAGGPTTWLAAGSSTTLTTQDGHAQFPVPGTAVIGAQSSQPGTQTIVFSANGISDTVTIVYSSLYTPLTTPERLVDTRTGQGGLTLASTGGTAPVGPIQPNTIYAFDATQTGLPSGAAQYTFNVTSVIPTGPGNLRIWGCGTAPNTSTVNFMPYASVPNAAIVDNGDAGRICIETQGAPTNVLVDATGYFSGDFQPVAPTRIYDSRSAGHTAIPANGTQVIQVAGVNNLVPTSGVKAVAVNVTSILPSGSGNLSVYPDGAALPSTSNINYMLGQDRANLVVVALPADGKLDLHSAGSAVNVAVDVLGYWTSSSPLQTQSPVRILDTRPTSHVGSLSGLLAPNVTYTFTATGAPGSGMAGVGAQTVFGNVTAVSPSTGHGNLVLFPAGGPVPNTSTVNYAGASPVANFTISGLSSTGGLSLRSAGSSVYVLYDLGAWYPATSTPLS